MNKMPFFLLIFNPEVLGFSRKTGLILLYSNDDSSPKQSWPGVYFEGNGFWHTSIHFVHLVFLLIIVTQIFDPLLFDVLHVQRLAVMDGIWVQQGTLAVVTG